MVNGCAGSARSWPIDLKLFDETDKPENKSDNYEETVPNDMKRSLDAETPVDAPAESPVDAPVGATEVQPQGSVEKSGQPTAPAGAANDKKDHFKGDEENKHSVNTKNLMSDKIITGTQCYMSMKIKNFI